MEVLFEPGMFVFLAQYLMFLHVAAFLSLFIGRGASALAFFICYLFFVLMMMALSWLGGMRGLREEQLLLTMIPALMISIALHFSTGKYLKILSSR